jgi:hypothetical protein
MKKVKCKFCGKTIIINNKKTNNIKFCSITCRNKYNYRFKSGRDKMRERRARYNLETYAKDELVQCLVCGKWYRQVGSHVVQVHGFNSAREYRKCFGFDLKKGQLPEDYRKIKAKIAIERKAHLNLKTGEKYRFKKGEKNNYIRSRQTMERLRKHIREISKERSGKYIRCLKCKKLFYVIPSKVSKAKYCSKKCSNESRT